MVSVRVSVGVSRFLPTCVHGAVMYQSVMCYHRSIQVYALQVECYYVTGEHVSWMQCTGGLCVYRLMTNIGAQFSIINRVALVRTVRPIISEKLQVLRPGGRFLCLEFSHVTVPGLRELYDAYSMNVIPQIGRRVASTVHHAALDCVTNKIALSSAGVDGTGQLPQCSCMPSLSSPS